MIWQFNEIQMVNINSEIYKSLWD